MKNKAIKKAALDIGTNSTRLLIVSDGEILTQETKITRIGEGLKEEQKIKNEPLARTIKVLQEYKEILSQENITDYRIVATSAMRDAVNKKEVLHKIATETGFHVEIISGEKEAELSYYGAIADFPGLNVVIDIGGGSSEVIYEVNNKLTFTSTNLGGVRLKEDPELAEKITELFLENIPNPSNLAGYTLVGVGGTATTIASVKLALEEYQWEKIQGLEITLPEIQEIHHKLKALSLEERKKVPGLQAERADIITYGTEILIKFMETYHFQRIKVSDKDLLFALAT